MTCGAQPGIRTNAGPVPGGAPHNVTVVRMGHRTGRDRRVTTHVFLAARALGADGGVLCGDRDDSVVKGIARVSELWGGKFSVKYEENWEKYVLVRKKAGAVVVHLTMYGELFEGRMGRLRGSDLIILVGAGKVPREAYEIADYNLSVSTQPHSEVSALALFLDRLFAGKELGVGFGGKMMIRPNKCGKDVVRVRND